MDVAHTSTDCQRAPTISSSFATIGSRSSHIPELWSFWGSTLKEWLRRYKCSGTAPLELVLKGGSNIPFDGSLRDTRRERASCDAIRSLHLRDENRFLLTSILSTLTPDDEDVRCRVNQLTMCGRLEVLCPPPLPQIVVC